MSINLVNYEKIKSIAERYHAQLVAVSKTKPLDDILALHHEGQIIFGENYVQELTDKFKEAPTSIDWHFIGHLQTNKVKYIQPIAKLIHGVDSEKLLSEINKQASKNNSISNILLQIHIAQEETKFGLDENELAEIIKKITVGNYPNIKVKGLMGMASFTDDRNQIKKEFDFLKTVFDSHKIDKDFDTLSMGMSSDYQIALDCGSTMIRIGSALFGERNYNKS
ncbi:MAG: YggS family pyridoxal phosphate-dependent enzyme [Bacteroidota bacterium]